MTPSVSAESTSASSPTVGALFALINDARLSAGKPPMGFLNPFLYSNADAFTDVTQGTNAVNRGGGNVRAGYAATKGWDAATGLGTPKFSKLLSAAMAAAGNSVLLLGGLRAGNTPLLASVTVRRGEDGWALRVNFCSA